MASSPDSSSTVDRRQRPVSTNQTSAYARARTSPRPIFPQPDAPGSASTRDEPSSSLDRPRPTLPRVVVPTFPERNRSQGQQKRNADADPPSPRHRMTKRQRKGITAKEKLHWLKMQDSQPDLSNRALAKLAKVQPCQIRDWKKMRERLEVSSSCRRRLMGVGRKSKFPFMERAVYRQFLKHRGRGLAVLVSMLQKWSAKYMKHRMPGVNWRASFRWATCFHARWHLARRVKTKMGQKLAAGKCCAVVLLDCHLSAELMCLVALLADCKAKVESFWEFVRQMRSLHDYPLDLILNADQTPLFLEMLAERTLEMKGARTVHVRSAGYEKERITVMLAVTASGLKLPPYVVFKRKTIAKVPIPAGVVVRAQDKGWMDESLVQDWITQVMVSFLKPLRESTGRRREALVVLDSYRGHLNEVVGQTMRMFRLSRAVIPGGCTPLVQPLDVSINRAFKCDVRHRYSSWFEEEGINTTTKAGNLKKPPAELVLRWIDESWEAIPEELVKKAFVTCGISTPIDGSEDHLILAHMRDKGEVEVLDDVNDLVDDELVVNPFYAEVPMPAEVLQAAAEEADVAEEDAEAAAAEEEGGVLEEGGEAEEPSDDEWWRPGRFDGEDHEEWHG
ncbi:unnamed protein product [Closterium sp. NIES-53]